MASEKESKREMIKVNPSISLEERNKLVKLAKRYLGYESFYVWNASINGIIIQLQTNDEHLHDFWQENWYPAGMDRHLKPHGIIYAVTGISTAEPQVNYHSKSKTGIVFNTSYERIRSLCLGIVMDIADEPKEMHFIRGSLIDVNGEGVIISGCSGSGKSTHTYLLLELDKARIHSDEWIHVERLGGEKGRLSTVVSERKFYLKKDVIKISPRIKELYKKCKKDDAHFILDPWWIGGNEKFLDTTRIKVVFILDPDPQGPDLVKRLDEKEALSYLLNAPEPLCNPHIMVFGKEQKALHKAFLQELLEFAPCYVFNTAKPLFDVQKKMREILLTNEYTQAISEPADLGEKPEKLEAKISLEDITDTVKGLYKQLNVTHPTPQQVEEMADKYGARTKFGNYNFVSSVKNRSAGLTVYIGSPSVMQKELNPRQKEIIKNLPKTVKEVHEYLKKAPFICTERTIGNNPYFNPKCTMYVSVHRAEMARLAHMVNKTLFEKRSGPGPEEYLIMIPEWHEKDRQILVFPEIGITYALGTDYYGEAKKAFLRMAMWFAKQKSMLGLHAGAKIIRARDTRTGRIRKYGMLLLGLTATGKTTHSCHNHGLVDEGEGVEIAQDDVAFLRPDGSVLGTEKGFYLKTEGINREIQPLIYNAVTKPEAVFENVMVDYLGNVYFGDETLTGNGRGIMQRDDFGDFKSESVNLPPVSELDGLMIVFITRRNTVVPIVSKLSLEQVAATFMLGESIETSGSDPKRAGESVREVGTNPFIIGDYAGEGNRFYEIIKKCPEKIECYLVNTGGVGEIMERQEDGTKILKQKFLRVQIPEMAAIIRGIARGNIEWTEDPYFGTLVPKRVEGMDIKKFDLNKFYTQEQIDGYVRELKRERIEWLQRFKGLNPKIINSIKQ